MSKIIFVFKNELINTLLRKSFLLTLFLMPLLSFGVVYLVSALQPNQPANPISQMLTPASSKVEVAGYIDHANLLKALPPGTSPQAFKSFASEQAADKALAAGEINGYYIIAPDFMTSGNITAVRANISPLASADQTNAFRRVIEYNLLNGDAQLAARVDQPFNLQTHYLNQNSQRDPDNLLTFFVPYAVTMIFYIVILGSASLMLNSLTTEKQNRVMEILVTSITPYEMLVGKILALGLVGLLQTLIWTGAGYALLSLSGQTFSIPVAFQLPPSILLWGVLFFLLGYAFYASVMAGVGALVPSLREASQVTFIIILPLMVPLMLIAILVKEPNGVLAQVLSLIPLTAPITVMMRLAAGSVPLWQILLAAVLLLISALLMIRSVAGLFRAQNLLSGQAFNWKVFVKALAGK